MNIVLKPKLFDYTNIKQKFVAIPEKEYGEFLKWWKNIKVGKVIKTVSVKNKIKKNWKLSEKNILESYRVAIDDYENRKKIAWRNILK
jgi:hypothetical protein